jgi:hypothetical protein
MTEVLLIHSDDEDGSTTFVDSSPSEHSITPLGDTHHEVDQKKFCASSIYFDGNDRLSLGDSADWDLTSVFTIDFWFRTTGTSIALFLGTGNANNSNEFEIEINRTAGKITLYSAGSKLTSTNTFNDGDWHHLALVGDGTYVKLYVDGDQEASATYAPSWAPSGMYFGGSYASTAFYTGYLDEIRILKGEAEWSSNFTPPTSPYDYTCGGSVELIDTSLELSAYHRQSQDLASFLRTHDGIEFHDITSRLEAADWDMEDLAAFLSAYYDKLQDAGMDLATWGVHYDDLKSFLAAHFQNVDDFKAALETWATRYDDHTARLQAADWHITDFAAPLGAWAQSLSPLAIILRAVKYGFKNVSTFLRAHDGIELYDLGLLLYVIEGIATNDLGLNLRVIKAGMAFRSVTAQKVSSVLHEVS